MKKLDHLKAHLKPGRTYCRADLEPFSKSVDRHLEELVTKGVLQKLSAGLYYCPKRSLFGEVPADDQDLLRTFLKDDRFLLTSPNSYNSLGLGTTQIYNKRVVYNHKRHGEFVLGGRTLDFKVKHLFPIQSVNEDFLLVDSVNNLNELAEDRDALLERVGRKAFVMDARNLRKAVTHYANNSSRKIFSAVFAGEFDKLSSRTPKF